MPEGVWSAQVLGNPLVSTESLTFAGHRKGYVDGTQWEPHVTYQSHRPRGGWDFDPGTWRISPQLMRRHMARHYAKGVNRIQIHSYSYTPLEADPTVWRMYAPIHLNERVPWWPYAHHLMDWSARAQFLKHSKAPVFKNTERVLRSVQLEGPWTLAAKAEDGLGLSEDFSLSLNELKPWRELPELHDYAGVATYTTEFDWDGGLDGSESVVLSIGKPYELASVSLNGEALGAVWHYPYQLEITDALKSGSNQLQLEVPNVLLNYEAREQSHYPRPSGLLGPIELIVSISE